MHECVSVYMYVCYGMSVYKIIVEETKCKIHKRGMGKTGFTKFEERTNLKNINIVLKHKKGCKKKRQTNGRIEQTKGYQKA